jgi:ABC-2 type transport system permease protein
MGNQTGSEQPEASHGVVFQQDLSLKEAHLGLRAGELTGAVVLPEGLSERLEGGQPVEIEVLVSGGEPLPRVMVEGVADRLVQRVRERNPLPLQWKAVLEKDDSRSVENFSSFSQSVAGNGVMFVLLNCMVTGGLAIAQERRQNTLSRLLISPLTPSTLIFGKTLGVVIVGLAQAVMIFGFGVLVGVKLGSPLGIFLVTLLFILVGSALGLTISALAQREETIQAICTPIALIMTALGGGMFPVEMGPPWLKHVSLIFPTGWAMDAYHKLMFDGRAWTSVLPNLGVLAGFAALFFAFGIRSLRWD